MIRVQKAFLVASTLFLLVSAARAQDNAPSPPPNKEGETAPPPVIVPPKLQEYIKAEYPPDAMAAGMEANVTTELDIDETGLVVGVTVTEPAGHGFDEAAEDALYRFVFSPALRDGVPIPSKVVYRYRFFLEEAPPEPENLPPPAANLSGMVSDMDGAPISDAAILIATKEAEEMPPIATDDTGFFSLTDLTPDVYRLEVIAPGFKPLSVEEALEDGESREVLYRLELEESMYETVVRARKPPREVTRREVTRREITRIPGTGGDALRSIQNLPGMARASYMGGALIVRGSSPEDSLYYFDSIPVPMLYHFGGLTSIINSDLLESIDFYPGNFSTRYGGATGGIVEVYPKTPETDRIHGYIDADLMDAGFLVEGPIGKNWSVAVSGRRSYIDGILNAVLPDNDGFSFTVAPRYYDYQVVADYHPSKKDNLRLFWFGSDDKLVFVLGEDVIGSTTLVGGISFRILLHQLQARWRHDFGGGFTNTLNVGTGFQRTDSGMGSTYTLQFDNVPFYLRNELAYDEKRNIAYRIGLDLEIGWGKWTVRAPSSGFGLEGEPSDPLSANEDIAESVGNKVEARPGVYAELEFRPVEKLTLISGLRFDYYDSVEKTALDPRLAVRYQLFENTVLKGGIGMFHQEPTVVQTDPDFGNPNLGLINAMHYSIGAEQKIYKNIDLSLEGFFKRMRNLVSSDENTTYNNDGTGKVWGMELLLKHQDNGRFFGWISYTLMRSERIDHPGDKKRLFDYDQTHILTIVASAVLGRGWEAGLRFRLVSGNPDTPVIGSLFDSDSDIYWPIYGDVNSKRLPLFHQLDIRVDKKWTFKHLKLAVYLDIQNIYNHKNVEGYLYNYDYTERQYLNGLPVIPSIGFKIEY